MTMKHCGNCGQTKPVREFSKLAKSSDGLQGYCKECSKLKNLEYRNARRNDLNAAHRSRAEGQRDLRRNSSVTWRKNNADLVCQQAAKRRAVSRKATPDWANTFFIKEAYRLAELRSKVTGFEWHVDHVVPLNSPIVCGLHCEHNLDVIPANMNLSKSNRHWPDMPI